MDVTALARSLLEPIPAHHTAGIEVLYAVDGASEVVLVTAPAMANVIGSLHSSGLITLIDAAGLAAIIAASEVEDDFQGVVPLGAAASLEFRAPARGGSWPPATSARRRDWRCDRCCQERENRPESPRSLTLSTRLACWYAGELSSGASAADPLRREAGPRPAADRRGR